MEICGDGGRKIESLGCIDEWERMNESESLSTWRLVEIFKAKIKAKLDEIWGDEEDNH